MRISTTCATSVFLGSLLLQPAMADEKTAAGAAAPSATLELESEQMRLIYGGTAGKGTLHFQGKDYAFTFKTASAGLGAKAVTSAVISTGARRSSEPRSIIRRSKPSPSSRIRLM